MEEECLSKALRNVRVWDYAEVREALMSVYSEPVTLAKKVRRKNMNLGSTPAALEIT